MSCDADFEARVAEAVELRIDALRKTLFEMPVHMMETADEALVWLVEHTPWPVESEDDDGDEA